MVKVLLYHGMILLLDLFLELLYLMVHHRKLLPHVGDLLSRLHQILGVQVLVSTDCLVHVFLLAELCFLVLHTLLQLGHLVVSVLQLVARILVALLRYLQLPSILFTLTVQLMDALDLQVQLHLPSLEVLPKSVGLRLVAQHQFDLLLRAFIGFDHSFVEDVPLVEQINDLFAVNLSLPLQGLHLLGEDTNLILQLIPCSFKTLRLEVTRLLLLPEDIGLFL
mmetsp:Transcript_59195/g.137862  ORF Transcript_59195/g.137862 Transcript_59195/m.137862 type:complete len:222 (-) Transcript_59195:984-1649(-)